jgi:hypothetical protein
MLDKAMPMILLVCDVLCAGALGALNAVDAVFDGVKTGIEGLAVAAVSLAVLGLFSAVDGFVLGLRMLKIFAWSSACCLAIDCESVA